MREIVRGHGVVWVAKKAAELGYHIPSTIRKEEVPTFNFWLERYMDVPFERYVYALSQDKDFDVESSLPEDKKKIFHDEMKERKWFEEHLEDFHNEFEDAVDFITDRIMDRKYMKRCFKSLPACCFTYLKDLSEDDLVPLADGQGEEVSQLLHIQMSVFRNEWAAMKKLEDEGYILIHEANYGDEFALELHNAFTNFADGKPYEIEDPEDNEKSLSLQLFILFTHVTLIIPKGLRELVENLLTEREETRLKEQSLVHEAMEIVNQFYDILPIDDILKIAQGMQKLPREPKSFITRERLIQCIKQLDDSQVVEIEGIMYGVSSNAYHEHQMFCRFHGHMSIQEYRTAVNADADLYDTVYELLASDRLDNASIAIWDPALYKGFELFRFLTFKSPYLRLFALLAVIEMEERNMDSMFANMFNSFPGTDSDEESIFHKEVLPAEAYLQRVYAIVNALGDAMHHETSLAAFVELLKQYIGFSGLTRETQEQLLDRIRECYTITPNAVFRGGIGGEENNPIVEDYVIEDRHSESDEDEYDDEYDEGDEYDDEYDEEEYDEE